ncbi:MAG: zn-dependent protease [Candidatus Saccharibacteria bacterium]|nr:zn-dependent protease [Candidatus Saccharibacteria bacterium]
MLDLSDDQFQHLIDVAFDNLPKEHRDNIKNVAILYEDDPTPEQRLKLELRHDQTLLGLYEGVPVSQRQGMTRIFPDKITLFKGPLTRSVETSAQLQAEIYHTLWHEIAHYYGLDHKQIHNLEGKPT